MAATIRFPRTLYEEIRADLERPHPHALERVGWLLARWTTTSDGLLVLAREWRSLADERYLPDDLVGARIDSTAIREGLQAALSTGDACFHVHLHPDHIPTFTSLDLVEQDRLMRSFVALNPTAPHGAVVFTSRGGEARIWGPDGAPTIRTRNVRIVGNPMIVGGDEP